MTTSTLRLLIIFLGTILIGLLYPFSVEKSSSGISLIIEPIKGNISKSIPKLDAKTLKTALYGRSNIKTVDQSQLTEVNITNTDSGLIKVRTHKEPQVDTEIYHLWSDIIILTVCLTVLKITTRKKLKDIFNLDSVLWIQLFWPTMLYQLSERLSQTSLALSGASVYSVICQLKPALAAICTIIFQGVGSTINREIAFSLIALTFSAIIFIIQYDKPFMNLSHVKGIYLLGVKLGLLRVILSTFAGILTANIYKKHNLWELSTITSIQSITCILISLLIFRRKSFHEIFNFRSLNPTPNIPLCSEIFSMDQSLNNFIYCRKECGWTLWLLMSLFLRAANGFIALITFSISNATLRFTSRCCVAPLSYILSSIVGYANYNNTLFCLSLLILSTSIHSTLAIHDFWDRVVHRVPSKARLR